MSHPADELFGALADPTRRRLLALLRRGERCVGDLVAVLRAPQPTVSRHLARLRRAGLVRARSRGTWSFYRLASPASPLHRRLLDCVDLDAGDGKRDRIQQRSGGCCPDAGSCR